MRKGVLILTLLMAVSLTTSVAALGVASPYWKERALVLAPGQTTEFDMNLQNLVGEDDFTMRASILAGQEVATIVGAEDYLLNAGDTKNVRIRVEAPSDAVEGNTYLVTANFQTVTEDGEGGGVQLGLGVEKSFTVEVAIPEEIEEEVTGPAINTNVLWAIVIVAILVLLWWLLQRNQKKRR